jgi:hypothetical protein
VIQRTVAVIKDADAIPKLGVFLEEWVIGQRVKTEE